MARHVAQRHSEGRELTYACPQLPPSPEQAMAVISALVATWPRDTMAVIGSSLGGFYATVLSERLGCRAAVINPAVAPARDLARYIGELENFHQPEDRFFFRAEFIAEFEALSPYPIAHPEHFWALIAEGDEVLNWREMVAHYPGVKLKLLDGGDHAISDFEDHLPDLVHALQL